MKIANQLTITPNNLTTKVAELNNNLALLQPNKSQTTQAITYTLVATALVGIFVYHYIKEQENQ